MKGQRHVAVNPDRISQPRNYLLYFICSDDKLLDERPLPLWAQILEGLHPLKQF